MKRIKRLVSLLLIAAMTLLALPVFADTVDYDPEDKAKLTAFFEQADENGIKNGDKLFENYSPDDPATWVGRTELFIGQYADCVRWTEEGRLFGLVITNRGLVGPLDLSGCESIEFLYCWSNYITSIDVSGCTALFRIEAEDNLIESVDLAGCTAVFELDLDSNRLTELDTSVCAGLNYLHVSDNLLSSIDVSGKMWLEALSVNNNRLTSLRIPADCAGLHAVGCAGNMLTELTIDKASLGYLDCSDNPFTSLDLTGVRLYGLKCIDCPLSELHFKVSDKLISLYSGGNGTVGAKVDAEGGDDNTSVIAVAEPDRGYILDAWYDDNGNWAYFYNESEIWSEDMGDVSLTAVFEEGSEPQPPQPDHPIWDGSLAEGFAGGRGTAAEPYLISNGAELHCLAMMVNGGRSFENTYFELTDDIYLNECSDYESWGMGDYETLLQWRGIGSYYNNQIYPFKGVFNGRGHTVYGLFHSYANSTDSFCGLFGYTWGAVIKNVNVSHSALFERSASGLVVGYAKESDIFNCSAVGIVDSSQGSECGGVIGAASSSRISGCTFRGHVEGFRTQHLGGVAGHVTGYGASVDRCVNYGSVYSAGTASCDYCGGIAGSCDGYTPVSNCRNEGTITADKADYVGGITGQSDNSLVSCVNLGSVSCENGSYVGGVTGRALGSVSCCANRADVSSGGSCVGGVVGESYANIDNCFNSGSVTGQTAGGVVCSHNSYLMKCCYNVGEVGGTAACGAVVYQLGGEASVSFCYYHIDSCEQGGAAGVPLTDGDMRHAESYAGFDFDNIWTMDGAANYPYAELISIYKMCRVFGDVDGNGIVNANDALMALRYALGLIGYIDTVSADVNGDGVVSANDALMIMRAALGLASL